MRSGRFSFGPRSLRLIEILRVRTAWTQDEDGLHVDGNVRNDGEKQIAGEQKKAAEGQAGDSRLEHSRLAPG